MLDELLTATSRQTARFYESTQTQPNWRRRKQVQIVETTKNSHQLIELINKMNGHEHNESLLKPDCWRHGTDNTRRSQERRPRSLTQPNWWGQNKDQRAYFDRWRNRNLYRRSVVIQATKPESLEQLTLRGPRWIFKATKCCSSIFIIFSHPSFIN